MKYIRTYLCGPMEGCTDEEASGWRNEVMAKLHRTIVLKSPTGQDVLIPKSQFFFLTPMLRDYRHLNCDHDAIFRVAPEIVILDKRDVESSDLLIVNAFKSSTGTPMEVLYAFDREKVIVSIVSKDGPLSPWLAYHSTVVVYSVAEAVEWVLKNVR